MDVALEDLMAEISKGEAKPFQPCAVYNTEGDTLEIYLSDDVPVAERVGKLFTVFVAAEDRERVVGLAIKNMKRHLGERTPLGVFLTTTKASVAGLLFSAYTTFEFDMRRRPQPARGQPGATEGASEKEAMHKFLHRLMRYMSEHDDDAEVTIPELVSASA